MFNRLRYLTAGESHGPGLTGILEGLPAGIFIRGDAMRTELKRRQQGFGRGKRMQIEDEQVEIHSGVRYGKTLGSPVSLWLPNRDWQNWQSRMQIEPTGNPAKPVTLPRPGHADFTGAVKYGTRDIRDILERASARETAMRVALGFLAKQFLRALDIRIASFVTRIGTVIAPKTAITPETDLTELKQRTDESPVRCLHVAAAKAMLAEIEAVQAAGDSVGGCFNVVATGLPIGLGSHVHWDRKLDARLAAALMSINAAKSVTLGSTNSANLTGTKYQDEILKSGTGLTRASNHAGGIEGGMSNGMPLEATVSIKPIPTLAKPLRSVDLVTGKPGVAHKERTDFCVVPAAGVIGEAMLALILADAILEKFGGDHLRQVQKHLSATGQYLRTFNTGK